MFMDMMVFFQRFYGYVSRSSFGNVNLALLGFCDVNLQAKCISVKFK